MGLRALNRALPGVTSRSAASGGRICRTAAATP